MTTIRHNIDDLKASIESLKDDNPDVDISGILSDVDTIVDDVDELESWNNEVKEVLTIYLSFHNSNKHKMETIPVCSLPDELFN